ncbi:hypothetical protein CHUAL_012015 [Chamberlinius hualienensis]
MRPPNNNNNVTHQNNINSHSDQLKNYLTDDESDYRMLDTSYRCRCFGKTVNDDGDEDDVMDSGGGGLVKNGGILTNGTSNNKKIDQASYNNTFPLSKTKYRSSPKSHQAITPPRLVSVVQMSFGLGSAQAQCAWVEFRASLRVVKSAMVDWLSCQCLFCCCCWRSMLVSWSCCSHESYAFLSLVSLWLALSSSMRRFAVEVGCHRVTRVAGAIMVWGIAGGKCGTGIYVSSLIGRHWLALGIIT